MILKVLCRLENYRSKKQKKTIEPKPFLFEASLHSFLLFFGTSIFSSHSTVRCRACVLCISKRNDQRTFNQNESQPHFILTYMIQKIHLYDRKMYLYDSSIPFVHQKKYLETERKVFCDRRFFFISRILFFSFGIVFKMYSN